VWPWLELDQDLEDEAAHDPAQGGQQVSHREAEDQTRDLANAKTAK